MTEKDCHEWKLTTFDPQERSTWRSGERSAVHAASQRRGSLMWMMPLHVNQNQMMMMMMMMTPRYVQMTIQSLLYRVKIQKMV